MVATTWSDSASHLRHEVHGVFGATIDFGMARLAAEPLDLGDHHPAHANGSQRFADLLQLERLDCCNDELHILPLSVFGRHPWGGTLAADQAGQ
jgi:hypothetical protein